MKNFLKIFFLGVLILLGTPTYAQTTLNAITAATAAQTGISNGGNTIAWNWDATGSGFGYMMSFSESAASTISGNPTGLVNISTLSGSTLVPLTVQNTLASAQTLPTLQILPFWNTTGIVTGGIYESVTDSASGAGSLMINLVHNSATEFSVDKVGNGNFAGAVLANNFSNTLVATTVSCSTSGTVKFAEPYSGTTDKRVKAYAAACIGTASFTFPTAFTNTPAIVTTNGPAGSLITSLSTTAMTITGTTTTGFFVLEGW